MIVDFRIPEAELASLDDAILQHRISVLARAMRRGDNLIVMSRQSARWIAENVKLIDCDRAAVIKAGRDFTQQGALVHEATCYIKVSATAGDVYPEGSSFTLPIKNEYFEDIISKPIFVTENVVSDTAVYRVIFGNMPDVFSNFQTSFEARHGGGQTTVDVALQAVGEKRIVYVVIDSDRKAPVEADKKMAKLLKLQSKAAWPLFFGETLPCRELENVFGTPTACQHPEFSANTTIGRMRAIINKERNLGHGLDDRFDLFFDFKDGQTHENLGKITDPLVAKWITDKIMLSGKSLAKAPLNGLGPAFASQIVGTPACLSQFHRTIRSQDWQAIFGSLMRQLMWVFAAAPPQRT